MGMQTEGPGGICVKIYSLFVPCCESTVLKRQMAVITFITVICYHFTFLTKAEKL